MKGRSSIELGALAGDDWKQVFGEPDRWPAEHPMSSSTLERTPGDTKTSLDPFTRADVCEVVHIWEHDEGDWGEWEGAVVVRLKDGRYASLYGWCDTTGWGCQDGVERVVASDYDTLMRLGVRDEDRGRWGLEQPS